MCDMLTVGYSTRNSPVRRLGFASHYHTERNHQGLDNRLIEINGRDSTLGTLECAQRLGGMLRFYHRVAA